MSADARRELVESLIAAAMMATEAALQAATASRLPEVAERLRWALDSLDAATGQLGHETR